MSASFYRLCCLQIIPILLCLPLNTEGERKNKRLSQSHERSEEGEQEDKMIESALNQLGRETTSNDFTLQLMQNADFWGIKTVELLIGAKVHGI